MDFFIQKIKRAFPLAANLPVEGSLELFVIRPIVVKIYFSPKHIWICAVFLFFNNVYITDVSSALCRILGHALCIKSQMFEVRGINVQLGYFVLTK